ncbi:hypothetical protein [Streptomyces sp. NPDC002133]|uniref:hypothetical protein n=1 Tax=Streptomyces sp. NPDC002133 TaxID=3154409 RepID=UPI003318376B
MDDPAETPEVNNQTATGPSQSTSEDGQTTSVTEKVKGLFKNNKKAIIATVVFATGLAVSLAKEQATEQYVHEDIETDAPFPAPAPEEQERQARSPNHARSHLMKIGDRQASQKAQEAYRLDTGADLPLAIPTVRSIDGVAPRPKPALPPRPQPERRPFLCGAGGGAARLQVGSAVLLPARRVSALIPT